jgi:YD repeat-containing protein
MGFVLQWSAAKISTIFFLPPTLQSRDCMFFLCARAFTIRRAGEGKMTARTERIMFALVIAALTAVAATASETISYSYDARGRLVQVRHSGTVNSNVTANYQYDKADNRTNVNVTSPNPAP